MSILINDIKYSIVSIDDRANDNKENIRKVMSNFQEIYIDCVNGNTQNTSNILDNLNISLKNWSWHSKPRGGEIGLWLSNINLFNKMINENIENVLLFEDDAIITKNLPDTLNEIAKEAPEDYDFISLVFPVSSKYIYRDDANIGLDTLCLAKYNHFGTYAILWSKQGGTKNDGNFKIYWNKISN